MQQQSPVLIIHIIPSQVNRMQWESRGGGILYLSIVHTIMREATFEREILKWYCCRNNTLPGATQRMLITTTILRSSYLLMANEREREREREKRRSYKRFVLAHLIMVADFLPYVLSLKISCTEA